jgi:hypothetical protein
MRRSTWLFVALLLASSCGGEPGPRVHSQIAVMPPLHIDRIYRSMAGPVANETLTLHKGPTEILWITAYRTEVVEPDGETPASGEFMCHTNLVLRNGPSHRKRFGWNKPVERFFTTSQGQFEVKLPEGFGIPVLSNEPLVINTQVLNHNVEEADVSVRFRVTIDYVRDAEARGRLVPVYPTMAYVMALVEGDNAYYGVEDPSEIQEGASCLPGHVAPQAPPNHRVSTDDLGQKFTGHWVVPPGREVRHTLVTGLLNIPFDTTLHFVATHVHPFAESLTLRDLTTGETLYEARTRGTEQGVGLAWVDSYTSVEGIPVYADHEYEMVSVYDNTSGEDQDAMATFVLYLRDQEAESGLAKLRVLHGSG